MQNREFEKQVQQKMQDLRFAPGPEIWARVEADIRKKKRRRPVVLWLLFAGLLIGGSGLVYTMMNTGGKTSAASATVQQPTIQQQEEEQQQPRQEQQQEEKTIIEHSNKVQQEQQQPTVIKEIIAVNTSTKEKKSARNRSMLQSKKEISDEPKTLKEVLANKMPYESEVQKIISTDPSVSSTATATPQQQQQLTTVAKEETSIAMNNKPAKQPAKNNRWQWGINAGIGISDVGMELFKGSNVADLASVGGGMIGIPGGGTRKPSAIDAGIAYQAGGFVTRSLSKKLGVKAGLNYEYYSNSVMVGTQYNTSRVVNQGSTMKVVDEYFTTGSDAEYTNKYHFVSLPVSVQWKVLDRRKHGLVWENGINISQLLSANALYYDGISGTYYKDNNLFNKTQWAISSALLYTIKAGNKLQLYAGPHVQYALSNLVAEDAASKNHLRYAGLKIMAGFNKK